MLCFWNQWGTWRHIRVIPDVPDVHFTTHIQLLLFLWVQKGIIHRVSRLQYNFLSSPSHLPLIPSHLPLTVLSSPSDNPHSTPLTPLIPERCHTWGILALLSPPSHLPFTSLSSPSHPLSWPPHSLSPSSYNSYCSSDSKNVSYIGSLGLHITFLSSPSHLPLIPSHSLSIHFHPLSHP